jgi:folate-binding protein YgfZ
VGLGLGGGAARREAHGGGGAAGGLRSVGGFGRDFGPDNFPQETGIEEAVSYTKGCYLGQEIVARIHYRGGVQNVLRKLVFEGNAPAQGAALLHDGREAGKATTVASSKGLGILHRRAAEPGTRLEIEGGGSALVQD